MYLFVNFQYHYSLLTFSEHYTTFHIKKCIFTYIIEKCNCLMGKIKCSEDFTQQFCIAGHKCCAKLHICSVRLS